MGLFVLKKYKTQPIKPGRLVLPCNYVNGVFLDIKLVKRKLRIFQCAAYEKHRE